MRRILLTLLASMLLPSLTGCKPSAKRGAPLDLTIHFTCDTRGRLVPCGCFSGQFGGLTRVKTVLGATSATNELRLDVGDAIGGREDYHRLEYRQILRAYASMQFDAMNLGHREAALSAAHLRDLRHTSPVPLISANLLDKATGQPLFDTYRLLRRGAYTVAVVGVLDPRGLSDELGEGLAVERMETVLARLLPELRAKADAIILLAFTDEAGLGKLANEFYEIDLLLGGKVRQPAQTLTRGNRSLIFYTTNESRALGLVRVRLLGRSPLQALAGDILLMHDRIPEDVSVQAMAAAYRDEVRRARLSIDAPERLQDDTVPGVRNKSAYVGSESCLSCHAEAAKVWQRSGHARAFATLVRKQADTDPKCIGCHAVGFGTMSGYRREFGGRKLADVGCESCHGPGSLHVRQQESSAPGSFKFRPLGAGDCQQCHHGEFSRPFDWNTFWPHIAHGTNASAQVHSPSAAASIGDSPSK